MGTCYSLGSSSLSSGVEMTTEIAVLNRQAVALAADSAVSGETKIFPSANKIFRLTNHFPIGIMIYNVASFCGIPWETVIKDYRRELGESVFDTIAECRDHFLNYVHNYDLPEEVGDLAVSMSLVGFHDRIQERISKVIGYRIKKASEISDDEIVEAIASVFEGNFEVLGKADLLEDFEGMTIEAFVAQHEKAIGDIYEELFSLFEEAVEGLRKRIDEVAFNLCARNVFEAGYSGVVIAGFGEKDIFPSLKATTVGWRIADRLQFVHDRGSVIDFANGGEVRAFAQADVAHLFMEGATTEFQDYQRSLMVDFVDMFNEHMPKIVAEEVGLEFDDDQTKKIAERLVEIKKNMMTVYDEGVKEFKHSRYISPVIEVVKILPKSELALLAETLVNLTAIKRKMSNDRESVGGPTDVAVISKGDGFVWIKRKNYFDPSINHHFFDGRGQG